MNESCLLLEHGNRALKRYLKVCQRHDIHEVLRPFVMEIALDSSRERTTSIERSSSTGFLYGRLAPSCAYAPLGISGFSVLSPSGWSDTGVQRFATCYASRELVDALQLLPSILLMAEAWRARSNAY